ncbi:uncharacterized protein LODBEIA_P04470 [Lodderomyces beijingensis]|uniref:Uncharacterized protein n=1 Tax=Lodderomyces beijingensis TaxID=1775926 RepID=A0ABP0ZDH5_9ASCO
MSEQNYLLPFAFSKTSSFNDHNSLDTTPRTKSEIDENASGLYHTRRVRLTTARAVRPQLKVNPPSLKRRMGESFNDKDDVKKVAFGDKSEAKAENDEDEEEATMIDTEEECEPEALLPPSSPPVAGDEQAEPQFMSEFDFFTNPTTSFQVPKSPKREKMKNVQAHTSPGKAISSDADFGIDRFNRYKGSFNGSIKRRSSANGEEGELEMNDKEKEKEQEEAERYRAQAYSKARDIIMDAFENTRTVLDLQYRGLYSVPDEIKDLNNLVIFDSFGGEEEKSIEFPYQLYLTGNNLSELQPSLFKFTKLQVLSLRQNKLELIPPLIGKLTNLIDISLSSNRLKFLPYQILNLKKLSIVVAGPNPFIKIPSDAIFHAKTSINGDDEIFSSSPFRLKARSQVRFLTHKISNVPSLKASCLNVVANYDVSYRETQAWKRTTPKVYHKFISEAIKKGKFEDKCSECNFILVEPMAEVFEWWDMYQNKEVPIQRQFCSNKCVNKYLTQKE